MFTQEEAKEYTKNCMVKSTKKLRSRQSELQKWIAHDKWKLDLLLLHEENPDKYEDLVDETQEQYDEEVAKLQIIKLIIERNLNR